MQRSSESIANLASALAKAQIELVNPEKSLVGTVYPEGAGKEGRSFNYASLASGLDIVRKTLGQHEIAVMQTTAIDQPAGIVNLTTVLAHSSGEWMASDWPVCAIAETATPRRMGAALTYARRYALFTLVGIAGEDDLDAPDLQTPPPSQKAETNQTQTPQRPKGNGNAHLNGGDIATHRGDKLRVAVASSTKILAPDASAILRDRLIAELNNLGSADDAALWAHRSLREKNKLTDGDAQSIEEAFQAKVAGFPAELRNAPGEVTNIALSLSTSSPEAATPTADKRKRKANQRMGGVDKSVLAMPEPRRIRDREHIMHVAKQPCLVCGRTPSDAHHLRFTQTRALGRKVSDEFTVPLCRGHHRELHRCGDEAVWWSKAGIDPTIAARALWRETHPLPATEDNARLDEVPSSAPISAARLGPPQSAAGCDYAADGSSNETKPIATAGPQ
jgi:hypothetical protein